ncbi:hypothetical protein HQQ92_09560 [Shewanella sp. DC2-4]|uniref:hypothetical protein n=1 Tax=Shewanella sp. DC2-4 TaxID=2739431 RepID=UPI001566149E|nr:hypothetical protein [Shewanella sp. DC2-4]NRD32013.1 hypothetical protein [Shewanella sp. DC2-4]
MPIKNNVRRMTPEILISMAKSNLIDNETLTEAEVLELIFSFKNNTLAIDGPQAILDKLPRNS